MLPGDGQELYEAKKETRDFLTDFMIWAEELLPESGVDEETIRKNDEANIRQAYADFIQRTDIRTQIFRRDTGRFVGSTGLHRFKPNVGHVETGYFIRTSEQRKGFATEAANAMTRYAFEELEARCVTVEIATNNARSRGVAKKLNFAHHGSRPSDLLKPNGEIEDRHFWSCQDVSTLPDLDVRWGDQIDAEVRESIPPQVYATFDPTR